MFNVPTHFGFNVSPDLETPGFRVGPTGSPVKAGDYASGYPSTMASPANMGVLLPDFFRSSGSSVPITPASAGLDNCPEIIANCKAMCFAQYEELGGELGFVWMRRCIRDCVAPTGCSY